jgi:hypothetical protein
MNIILWTVYIIAVLLGGSISFGIIIGIISWLKEEFKN